MSDKTLKTVAKSDPDNWDILQSLFLETAPSSAPPSPSLDNWDELQSLFGLENNGTSESTDPPIDEPEPPIPATIVPLLFWWKWYWALHTNGAIDPKILDFWLGNFSYFLITHFHPSLLPIYKQIENTLAEADRAKRTAEAASFKTRAAQRTAETARDKAEAAHQTTAAIKTQTEALQLSTQEAQQATERIRTKAQADYHTIQTAKLSIQRTQQVAEAARTKIQAAYSTIAATKAAVQTAAAETETAKVNAQRACQATEVSRIHAEEANRCAQEARKAAETAQKRVEDILKTIDGSSPPPTNLLPDVLRKHKSKLLLGSIALIPLLLLLPLLSNLLRPPNPSRPIYVNPISGNDANNGSATAPFRTLSHALRLAGAGSEIYLAKGDYSTDRTLMIPDNTTLVIQPFNDIDGHWAAPFIRALAVQGLIAGYPDGSFQPDASLTRAEYATLLTKVFDLPKAEVVKNFSDVDINFWAYSSIQSTYSKNFLKGFPEGDFLPKEPVQRVQVIAALVSGLGLSPRSSESLNHYQDGVIVPNWAQQQVAAATTAQLVANYPNPQQLNPIQSATRAETVVMMYQALVKQGKMPAIESPYLVKQ